MVTVPELVLLRLHPDTRVLKNLVPAVVLEKPSKVESREQDVDTDRLVIPSIVTS